MPQDVSRCPLPSRADFYKQFGDPNVPAIFTGGMDRWAARKNWSFDWFKRTHGHVKVMVTTGAYDHSQTHDFHTLGDYIDSLSDPQGASKGYLANSNLLKLIPELKSDVDLPPYQWMDRLTLKKFWMARGGNVTQLHADFGHNVMGQIEGRKRFELYHPAKTPDLFPSGETWAGCMSQVDFKDADPHIRAAGQKVEADFDVILEPGELLFLPFGWWHRVHSLDPSIGVNLWWWTPQQLMARGPRMFRELGGSFVKKRVSRLLNRKPATA